VRKNNCIKKIMMATFAMTLAFVMKGTADVKAVASTDIATNNTWISGSIGEEAEVDYYMVSLSKSGWLSLDYQGLGVRDSWVSLVSEDLTKTYVAEKSAFYSSEVSPVNVSSSVALEAGRYLIKVRGDSDKTGSYKVRANFVSANNNESYTNHSFDTAQGLSVGNSINGFLSDFEKNDFYKINLTSKKLIRILFTSYMDDAVVQIWDKDYNAVYSRVTTKGSLQSPVKSNIEVQLNPGAYYIKVYSNSGKNGKYSFKLEEKVIANSISITGAKKVKKGKSIKLSVKFIPSNTSNKSVVWSSSNNKIATIDRTTGVLKAKKPGKVTIMATAQDGSKKSATYKVVVLPTKMKAPSIDQNVYILNRFTLSWKSNGYVTGYKIQYATNPQFRGAKTKTLAKPVELKYVISGVPRVNHYVRIKAYIKDGKKTYSGKWSKYKKVNIH